MTMTTTFMGRTALLLLTGLCVAGCENRGTFTGSCADGNRVSVPANAVSAIYFDATGQPLGTEAEDLEGTVSNTMCPTPPHDPDAPGACPAGYCARTVLGKTYCLRC